MQITVAVQKLINWNKSWNILRFYRNDKYCFYIETLLIASAFSRPWNRRFVYWWLLNGGPNVFQKVANVSYCNSCFDLVDIFAPISMQKSKKKKEKKYWRLHDITHSVRKKITLNITFTTLIKIMYRLCITTGSKMIGKYGFDLAILCWCLLLLNTIQFFSLLFFFHLILYGSFNCFFSLWKRDFFAHVCVCFTLQQLSRMAKWIGFIEEIKTNVHECMLIRTG